MELSLSANCCCSLASPRNHERSFNVSSARLSSSLRIDHAVYKTSTPLRRNRIVYISPLPIRRKGRCGGQTRASNHPRPGAPLFPPDDDSFLDEIANFIYRKMSPFLPKESDYLAWLPEPMHSKFHSSEQRSLIAVREFIHIGFFYFLYHQVDDFCKWLYWLYNVSVKEKPDLTEDAFKKSTFHVLIAPVRLLIVVWAVTRFIPIVGPFLKLKGAVLIQTKARETAMVASLAWFFIRLKQKYVAGLLAQHEGDAPRIIAFDKVVSLVLNVLAFASLAEVNGFALRSLLAVGGLSGIALSLAAKEIVSNFFGGLVLFVTRPFVIGDLIKAGSFSGIVQDIGFLSTKILSFERFPILVPNQNFIHEVITNYSRAKCRRFEATFPVRIQDIFLVERITDLVREYLNSNPEVDSAMYSPVCYFNSVNEGGIVISVMCVVRPTRGLAFYLLKQSICLRVAEIIVGEGASLGCSGEWEPEFPPQVLDGAMNTPGLLGS